MGKGVQVLGVGLQEFLGEEKAHSGWWPLEGTLEEVASEPGFEPGSPSLY